MNFTQIPQNSSKPTAIISMLYVAVSPVSHANRAFYRIQQRCSWSHRQLEDFLWHVKLAPDGDDIRIILPLSDSGSTLHILYMLQIFDTSKASIIEENHQSKWKSRSLRESMIFGSASRWLR